MIHQGRQWRLPGLALVGIFGAAILTSAAIESVQHPVLVRPLLAVSITLALCCLAVWRPTDAAVLTFFFLTFLALIRRILIPVVGWTSFDPLLLVGPAVCLFLIQRQHLARRRPLAPDGLSKLVLVLVGIFLLESLNPGSGGGILAGLVGLLFLAAPIPWFFVGQELGADQSVRALLCWLIVWAVFVAAYGLWQTSVGFPPWDQAWLKLGGYSALDVGGVTRAFGTFSSSQEYATYLTIGVILSLALTLHRRIFALAAIPLLAWALFLDSVRGGVILVLLAAIILLALRTRKVAFAAIAAILATVTVFSVVRALGPSLQAIADSSSNPLVAHQLNGLLAPLDPQSSTLPVHAQLVVNGIVGSFSHPIGLGTGTTNIGGEKLGASLNPTEVDVSNVFVSLGPGGGLLFLLIILVLIGNSFTIYARRGEMLVLAICGVLVVTLGQWLNGGEYAVAPLIWLLAGVTNGRRHQIGVVTERDLKRDLWALVTPRVPQPEKMGWFA